MGRRFGADLQIPSLHLLPLVLLPLLHPANGFGTLCDHHKKPSAKIEGWIQELPEPNTKVAFYGDVGNNRQTSSRCTGGCPAAAGCPGSSTCQGTIEVMQMVKDWGAEFVVHGGDFDYDDIPTDFAANVDAVFPRDFPYFINVGNHDVRNWRGTESQPMGYADWGEQRLLDSNTSQYCTGDYGVNQVCSFKGITFVMSGVGTMGTGHVEYIEAAFDHQPTAWRICDWHKNQRLMQVGGKRDEVGWAAYQMCLEKGALIVTNHEHSFCRSKNMADLETQQIANEDRDVTLAPGQTVVTVVGLGGFDVRPYQGDRQNNPWWAASAASDVGANYGALLCEFHIDGDPRKAHCEFRDIEGTVWDSFDMYTRDDKQEYRKNSTPPTPNVTELAIDNGAHDFGFVRSFPAPSTPQLPTTENLTAATLVVDEQHAAGLMFELPTVGLDVDMLLQAHLQVYGAATGQGLANVTVVGLLPMAETDIITDAFFTTAFAQWDTDDEFGEREEVWVSPDISHILRELLSHPAFNFTNGNKVPPLGLALVGTAGGPAREFFTRDEGPCVAPHLWVEHRG